MKNKKKTTIDDLAVMVARGFSEMDERFERVYKRFDGVDKRFDRIESRLDRLEKRIERIEADIIWIKEILEKHTKMLKDLSEEKIFIVHRIDRIEKEVELIKKRLKIA